MQWLRWALGIAVLSTSLCLAQTPVEAESPEPPASAEIQLPEAAPADQPVIPEPGAEAAPATTGPEEVLVTGEFPGPGLWKVMRRDDPQGHVLWILGTPPPLPKKLKWKSKDIEAVLLSSQAVLVGSEVNVEPDSEIGFFKGMSLLPSIIGIRNNPDKVKLKDVVPADLYEQWLVQKKKYLGRNETVETWRPIFAAEKLRDEAFDDTNLRESGVVWDVVASS